MFTPGNVILVLKIAVGLVTVLFAASLVALALKQPRWHGRINTVFFILTLTAVLGLEVIIRFLNPELTAEFTPEAKDALRLHLYFSIPAAICLPAMLYTGKKRLLRYHIPCAVVFTILWFGTFVTGMFFLPHS